MSSQEYSSEIRPEAAMRRLVVGVALAACLGGLGLIATLPVDVSWRWLTAFFWGAGFGLRLAGLVRGFRRCTRLRFGHDGSVQIVAPDGCCEAATILPGSVVWPNVAWLRLAAENGRISAELVRGKAPQNKAWRRFQVIWRHLGAKP